VDDDPVGVMFPIPVEEELLVELTPEPAVVAVGNPVDEGVGITVPEGVGVIVPPPVAVAVSKGVRLVSQRSNIVLMNASA